MPDDELSRRIGEMDENERELLMWSLSLVVPSDSRKSPAVDGVSDWLLRWSDAEIVCMRCGKATGVKQ